MSEYDLEVIKQLKLSKEIVGEVNPIIVDWDGELLSGQHRKQAGWQTVHKVDSRQLAKEWNVTPLMAKHMFRLHMNVQRKPSREETQKLLMELAKELEKKGIQKDNIASELVKIVPYSQRWIELLLPQELKRAEKAEAGKLGAEVVRQKMLAELVGCDRCFMASRDTTEYKGELLCPRCLEEAKHKPMKATDARAQPEFEVKEYKVKDTWEHRKARMQVPVSHMEQRLAKRLTEAGVKFETQVEFCTAKSIADFMIGRKAFFIDFEKLHIKREEKDEEARRRIKRFYDVEPFGLLYEADTKTEEDRLFAQMLEAIEKQLP